MSFQKHAGGGNQSPWVIRRTYGGTKYENFELRLSAGEKEDHDKWRDAFGALRSDSDNLSKTWPGVNHKAGVILRRDEA